MPLPASKRAPAKPAGFKVVLDFGGGDIEEVIVDLATFTYGEVHQVRRKIAELSVRDGQGRVVLSPSADEQNLIYAWTVLSRSREVDFQADLLDRLPFQGGLSVADVGPGEDDSPEV